MVTTTVGKIFATLAVSCFLGQPMAASLRTNLVGVWATDNSVLKGQILLSGEALYLGTDGIGAIVSGPPAIEVKVIASFHGHGSLSLKRFGAGAKDSLSEDLLDCRQRQLQLRSAPSDGHLPLPPACLSQARSSEALHIRLGSCTSPDSMDRCVLAAHLEKILEDYGPPEFDEDGALDG